MKPHGSKTIRWDAVREVLLRRGSVHTLSDADQEMCAEIAKRRFNNNRNQNIVDRKIGPQSNTETDLEGLAGEVALARLLGLEPDWSVYTRSSVKGEDHGDIVLTDGRKIDAKTTHYANGRLLVTPWKVPKFDLFALMIGAFPRYTFKGVIAASVVADTNRICDLGHGPTLIIEQSELHDLLSR